MLENETRRWNNALEKVLEGRLPKDWKDLYVQHDPKYDVKNIVEQWAREWNSGGRKSGLLLGGPPGCGKKTLAHLVCQKGGWEPFVANSFDISQGSEKDNEGDGGGGGKGGSKKKKSSLLDSVSNFCPLTRRRRAMVILNADGLNLGQGVGEKLIKLEKSMPVLYVCERLFKKKFFEIKKRCAVIELRAMSHENLMNIGYRCALDLVEPSRSNNGSEESKVDWRFVKELSTSCEGNATRFVCQLRFSGVKEQASRTVDERKQRDETEKKIESLLAKGKERMKKSSTAQSPPGPAACNKNVGVVVKPEVKEEEEEEEEIYADTGMEVDAEAEVKKAEVVEPEERGTRLRLNFVNDAKAVKSMSSALAAKVKREDYKRYLIREDASRGEGQAGADAAMKKRKPLFFNTNALLNVGKLKSKQSSDPLKLTFSCNAEELLCDDKDDLETQCDIMYEAYPDRCNQILEECEAPRGSKGFVKHELYALEAASRCADLFCHVDLMQKEEYSANQNTHAGCALSRIGLAIDPYGYLRNPPRFTKPGRKVKTTSFETKQSEKLLREGLANLNRCNDGASSGLTPWEFNGYFLPYFSKLLLGYLKEDAKNKDTSSSSSNKKVASNAKKVGNDAANEGESDVVDAAKQLMKTRVKPNATKRTILPSPFAGAQPRFDFVKWEERLEPDLWNRLWSRSTLALHGAWIEHSEKKLAWEFNFSKGLLNKKKVVSRKRRVEPRGAAASKGPNKRRKEVDSMDIGKLLSLQTIASSSNKQNGSHKPKLIVRIVKVSYDPNDDQFVEIIRDEGEEEGEKRAPTAISSSTGICAKKKDKEVGKSVQSEGERSLAIVVSSSKLENGATVRKMRLEI